MDTSPSSSPRSSSDTSGTLFVREFRGYPVRFVQCGGYQRFIKASDALELCGIEREVLENRSSASRQIKLTVDGVPVFIEALTELGIYLLSLKSNRSFTKDLCEWIASVLKGETEERLPPAKDEGGLNSRSLRMKGHDAQQSKVLRNLAENLLAPAVDTPIEEEDVTQRAVEVSWKCMEAIRELASEKRNLWMKKSEQEGVVRWLRREMDRPNIHISSASVSAPPSVVSRFLWDVRRRSEWDPFLESILLLDRIDDYCAIYRVTESPVTANQRARDHCVVMSCRCVPDDNAYVLGSRSIEHPSCPVSEGYVRSQVVLNGFYVASTSDATRSEVTFVLQYESAAFVSKPVLEWYVERWVACLASISSILNRDRPLPTTPIHHSRSRTDSPSPTSFPLPLKNPTKAFPDRDSPSLSSVAPHPTAANLSLGMTSPSSGTRKMNRIESRATASPDASPLSIGASGQPPSPLPFVHGSDPPRDPDDLTRLRHARDVTRSPTLTPLDLPGEAGRSRDADPSHHLTTGALDKHCRQMESEPRDPLFAFRDELSLPPARACLAVPPTRSRNSGSNNDDFESDGCESTEAEAGDLDRADVSIRTVASRSSKSTRGDMLGDPELLGMLEPGSPAATPVPTKRKPKSNIMAPHTSFSANRTSGKLQVREAVQRARAQDADTLDPDAECTEEYDTESSAILSPGGVLGYGTDTVSGKSVFGVASEKYRCGAPTNSVVFGTHGVRESKSCHLENRRRSTAARLAAAGMKLEGIVDSGPAVRAGGAGGVDRGEIEKEVREAAKRVAAAAPLQVGDWTTALSVGVGVGVDRGAIDVQKQVAVLLGAGPGDVEALES